MINSNEGGLSERLELTEEEMAGSHVRLASRLLAPTLTNSAYGEPGPHELITGMTDDEVYSLRSKLETSRFSGFVKTAVAADDDDVFQQ